MFRVELLAVAGKQQAAYDLRKAAKNGDADARFSFVDSVGFIIFSAGTFDAQSSTDLLVLPEPAYEFDQRIARQEPSLNFAQRGRITQ